MDLTLYVYGNGEFIFFVLTSVNFFMNNAMSFFKLAAVVSLLLFAVEVTGIVPTRGYNWSKFFKVYFIISLFVLTKYPGKVTVEDSITNYSKTANFTKQNLPFGLIYPIATISNITHKLITLYQQKFEIDKNLSYSYTGMNFGANFIKELDTADSYDDRFNSNFDLYMQNCGLPLLNRNGALSSLRSSSDIFDTLLKNTSNARFVRQIDFTQGISTITTCENAIKNINTYYNNNADKILIDNARRFGVSEVNQFKRFLISANTASKLLDISNDASKVLKQAIGMNMLMASLKNGAHASGNGSLALAAYDAEQFQQYKTTSQLSGAASARTVPVLVGIAFALLFLLYPIMVFLAIAVGSYRAIGYFLQIIVVINIIPLIFEILNYITTYYLSQKLNSVIVGSGYNYDISTSIYSLADNMIIAGNYLATATPIIAYAIVTGASTAFTSVFAHINDPAKSQSSTVGLEMARGNQTIGNFSLDNQSFNNVQGNKFDNQLSMNTGVPIMKDTTSGGIHTNAGGSDYYINYKSDLLSSINYAQMKTHSLENSLRNSQDQMSQLTKQWGSESRRINDLVNSFASGQNSTTTIGADDMHNLKSAQSLSSKIALEASINGKPIGIGVGLNASTTSSASDSLSHDLAEYKRVSSQLSHSSNQEIKDTFTKSNYLTDTTTNTMQEIVSKSQALTDVQQNQSAINTNMSNAFTTYLKEHGYDPTAMDSNIQEQMAQKFVDSEYGQNSLNVPQDHLTKIQGNKIDASGLKQPSKNAASVEDYRGQVQDAINDYKDHPLNIIGNQIGTISQYNPIKTGIKKLLD